MDEIGTRLVSCFKIIFPDLPESEIPLANQDSVIGWDSVAAITLMNVVEEEFGMQMDFDRLADLNSFPRIHEYLRTEVSAA